jgi:hypothetical protein
MHLAAYIMNSEWAHSALSSGFKRALDGSRSDLIKVNEYIALQKADFFSKILSSFFFYCVEQ